jgi:hypothetical protein
MYAEDRGLRLKAFDNRMLKRIFANMWEKEGNWMMLFWTQRCPSVLQLLGKQGVP